MNTVASTLLFIILGFVILASTKYSAVDDFRNCGVKRNGGDNFLAFYKFNDGQWRVKQVRVYRTSDQVMVGRNFWKENGGMPGFFPDIWGYLSLDFEFIYVDETRDCTRAVFDNYYVTNCPQNAQQITCPTRPNLREPASCFTNETTSDTTTCLVGTEDASDWHCANGNCLRQRSDGSRACRDLYTMNYLDYTINSARIFSGFRLYDCQYSMASSLTSNELIIIENNIPLSSAETLQKLEHVENPVNFIQLMISMCPRTLEIMDHLIESLNIFVNSSNLNNSMLALSVFDGVKDFIDIIHFTNDLESIQEAVTSLRYYTLQDNTCNVKQPVISKFKQFTSHVFGQPWDRRHFVTFSASADLVDLIPDTDVTFLIGGYREVSSFAIGLNIPSLQTSLFSGIGNTLSISTNNASTLPDYFEDIAQQIKLPPQSDYILKYCSPSRGKPVYAKFVWNLPDMSSLPIQEIYYNSSSFGAGCSTSTWQDICSPCSNKITQRKVICYDCFNSSLAVVPPSQPFSQVLLRYPEILNASISLQLPFPKGNLVIKYDVYIRVGGLSNPLLYDNVFLNTSERNIMLENAQSGDLIGVYVDWKGNAYSSAGIVIAAVPPPATVPVATPITAPHATPTVPPPPPLPDSAPVAIPIAEPNAIPAMPVATPIAAPSAIPAQAPTMVPTDSPVDVPVSSPEALPISLDPGQTSNGVSVTQSFIVIVAVLWLTANMAV
jgi:hypothetical protein